MRHWIIACLLGMVLGSGTAMAYSELHDDYSLDLKGYSPEMIHPVQVQINRMEGRYPTPAPGRVRQFFYNFFNSEWASSLKPFSQDTIQKPALPKHL